MRKLISCTIISFIVFSSLLIAQTNVNGRFVNVSQDSASYTVKFQVNTNTDNDTLGCSTIIFNFDTTSISFPAIPLNNEDYHFLNFTGPDYNSKITRPLLNQVWVNIESIDANHGTTVSQSPEWTDVVQLKFRILKQNGFPRLTWQVTNNNWGIYDSDNSTVWSLGSWSSETNVPLPVELTTFSADIVNNNVKLKWQTTTELNNLGFDIERAVDAKTLKWEKIGFAQGGGTSNFVRSYNFTDSKPIFNKVFYRLKQIDLAGTVKLSKEVSIDFTPNSFNLYQNYPNPFNPSTSIKFSLPYQTNVTIKIYDITGREITTLLNEKKDAGNYTINFSGNNLSSGVYFYSIICDNFTQVKKMLYLK